MTPHSSFLTSFISLSDNHITIANGTHILIHGRENVSLLSSLSLKDVLYVPKLSNNLIDVRKLTHDLNFSITFFLTHFIFQDLATWKTIGIVKEHGGLYCFNNLETKNTISRQTTTSCL